MESSIILYAVPLFVQLMAAEWLYGAWTGRHTYHANDCISSLSQGLLSQATAACTKLFQIGLYSYAFVHLAAFRSAAFWDTPAGWPGYVTD